MLQEHAGSLVHGPHSIQDLSMELALQQTMQADLIYNSLLLKYASFTHKLSTWYRIVNLAQNCNKIPLNFRHRQEQLSMMTKHEQEAISYLQYFRQKYGPNTPLHHTYIGKTPELDYHF